jgi:hypothetical protein
VERKLKRFIPFLVLLFGLLCVHAAYAQSYTLVQHNSAACSASCTSISAAFTQNNTAGSLLVGYVQSNNSASSAAVTDPSNGTWTLAKGANGAAIFYVCSAVGGVMPTVSVSYSGGTYLALHIMEFSGNVTSGCYDSVTGNAGAFSGSLAPSESTLGSPLAPDLVIWAGGTISGSATWTQSGSDTLIEHVTGNGGLSSASFYNNAILKSGTVTMSASLSASSSGYMAIAGFKLLFGGIFRDGHCAGGTTSCTFNQTQTGDLKIIFAMASGTTAPTVPSGWTKVGASWGTTGSSSSSNITAVVGCEVSSSSSDTGSGTWTTASDVVGISYSGTNATATATCPAAGIGYFAHTQGKGSATITYLATTTFTGANSWVAGFAGDHADPTCNPSTMTNVTTVGTGPEATANDTNAIVSSWGPATCSVTSSAWASATVEILAMNCNNTTINGNFTCVAKSIFYAASGSLTNVYAGGYVAGQTIVVRGYQNASTAYTSGMLTNTAGYSWTFFGACQSADTTRSAGVWYYYVTVTNSSSDTITLNSSYSGTFEELATVVYSGLGALDGPGIVCAKGTSGAPASGNYTVTVGDLLIGLGATAANTAGIGSGWTNRVWDLSNSQSPLGMNEDMVATSTTADATFSTADSDWLVSGLAFQVPAVASGGISKRRKLDKLSTGTSLP